jgi:hypothetical protein
VDHIGESASSKDVAAHQRKTVAADHSKNAAAGPSKTFATGQLSRKVDKGKYREITEDASDSESSVRQYLKTARRELRKVKAKLFTQRALAMCLEEEIENLERRCQY